MTVRTTSDEDAGSDPWLENGAGKPFEMRRRMPSVFSWVLKPGLPMFVIAILVIVVILVPSVIVVERVSPGHLGIVYSRTGEDLPPGQILAKKGQKGVREEFLTPGWHVINPLWTVEIQPELLIPAGMVGIQTSLVGDPLPEGQLLAESGQKGVLRELLTPGTYRIHPRAAEVEIEPELLIPAGMVGIQTSLVGDPLPEGQLLAESGQKGVLRELLTPGTYRIHPRAAEVETRPEVVIPAGMIGIQTSLVGDPLPEGQLLAESGQKGVLRELLTPGTYRIHPRAAEVEIQPEVVIPAGMIGIQTSLVGDPLPEGQLLAENGQKGVLRELLTPGTYRIHPREAKVELAPAVTIAAGYVGVQVANTGQVPTGNRVLGALGERGVQQGLLPAGMHFVNPYEFEIIPVDIRSQRYTMADKDAVQFPSKDGFEITINVIIEWGIDRLHVSEVVASFGTQQDIIDKIIRPNARSISRTEGSKYVAKDFIVGAGREVFQAAFFESIASIAQPKGIIIHRALVLSVTVPERIAAPIKETVVAVEEELRNRQQIETARSAAQLAFEDSLAQQNKRKVEAETKKLERQLDAEGAANEAHIEAEERVNIASLALEASRVEAQAILETGQAKAEVIRMEGEAEATGLAASVGAFGDGKAFAMYEFASKLSPNIKVVFAPAGEGTLWTSIDEFFRIGVEGEVAEKLRGERVGSE